MGFFVDFRRDFCRYEERAVAVGHGKNPTLFLTLFRFDHCKSIGSAWAQERRIPHCSLCYHDAVTILPDDTRRLNCPKRGDPARIPVSEGSWE